MKQLRNALGTNTEQIISGLEGLKKGQTALDMFIASFSEINLLCCRSVQATQTDGNLRGLATMHLNLLETLKSTETIAGLPEAAATAESMMDDRDSSLGMVQAHEYLSQVEATMYRIKNTLQILQHFQAHELPSLDTYFKQVHNSMTRIEHRLWSIIRSFIKIGTSCPEELVAALRVIETQELVDAKLLASGLGDCPLRKGWRHRCIQNMSASIAESFADILQQCSKLSSEANSGRLLEDILCDTSRVLFELDSAITNLVPCFPPKYQIEQFLWGQYKYQVDNIFEIIGAISGQLSNGDILHAMHWVQTHSKYLVRQEFDTQGIAGIDSLLRTYANRMDDSLRNWLKNIMNADFEAAPREDADGRLFTPGPQDMFRLLEEQLNVAKTGGISLLKRVVSVIQEIINDYALEYQKRISEASHSLEILCAVGNNCLQTCELVTHLNGTVGVFLPDSSNSPKDASSRFQYVAKQAGETCGQVVFMDPGFGELFSLLCDGEEWRAGIATGSMLATLDDFLADFRIWLDDYLLTILATSMLIECISYYLAALLSQLRAVDSDTLATLDHDISKIREYFKRYLPHEVVENECQILSDMCHFLSSDSIEAFVLSYMALLEQAPITPTLLLGVLNARVASQHDMTKSDAKEVIAACREAYDETRKSYIPKASSRKFDINPAIKNPSFIAAITCVRQRY